MKRVLYLVGIILVIVLGAYFQYRQSCGEVIDEPLTDVGFGLADFEMSNNDFEIDCEDNFNFMPGSSEIIMPVSNCIIENISKLKAHLDANPNEVVKIDGFYSNFEENNSVYPNMGIARANAIKKYLADKGIRRNQLRVEDGELSVDLNLTSDTIIGGADFDLIMEDDRTMLERMNSMKIFSEDLKKEPVRLYFQINQAYIHLTLDERTKIYHISQYLDEVEDAKLLIEGHTDTTGSRALNMELSKNRAEYVKEYFIQKGFDSELIETKGLGPDQPIADNSTGEGREMNRRVEIYLQ